MLANGLPSVAVVTGGGRGIGAASAVALAAQGTKVVVTARSIDEIERIASTIRAEGGEALAIAADVADLASVQAVAAAATHAFGPVDGLVNNAGIVDPITTITQADAASWADAVRVNLVGAFHCLQTFLLPMVDAGWGRVVAVSSSAAERGIPTLSAYSAGKAGFEALHRVAAAEVEGTGVTVTILWPGGTDTRMQERLRDGGFAFAPQARAVFDGDRLRRAEEVAEHVVQLAGEGALNGQRVDLGERGPAGLDPEVKRGPVTAD